MLSRLLNIFHVSDSYVAAQRSAQYILAWNVLLFLAKFFVGWFGNSFALVADAFNNVMDVGMSLAMVIALRIASRPPDAQHAYGHGKVETEIARIVGLMILITAGGIIVGAIENLTSPNEIPARLVLVVAAISIVIKEHMFRFQHAMAKRLSSQALFADAINHRGDVGATSCVLLGTIIVFLGGHKWAIADEIAAILVGFIMAFAAGKVVLSTTHDMLDAMPPKDIIDRIREIVVSVPGIYDTEKILGRKMGMVYNIDIHIEVDPDLAILQAHDVGHQAAERVKEKMPEIGEILVHLEPHLNSSSDRVDVQNMQK